MGATKTQHFTARQNNMAQILKALGHPARFAIMEQLIATGSCICGDIVKKLPLSQPTVSQHLKELKQAGLIKSSVDGNAICYCVNEKAVDQLQRHFTGMTQQLNERKKCA